MPLVDGDGKVPVRDAVPEAGVASANCVATVAGRGSDVPVVDVVQTVPVKGAVFFVMIETAVGFSFMNTEAMCMPGITELVCTILLGRIVEQLYLVIPT